MAVEPTGRVPPQPPQSPQPQPAPPAQGVMSGPPQTGRGSPIWHPRLPGRKPPKIIRGPGVTVHGQIEDWLADEIAAGRLAPRGRLPAQQGPGGRVGGRPGTL